MKIAHRLPVVVVDRVHKLVAAARDAPQRAAQQVPRSKGRDRDPRALAWRGAGAEQQGGGNGEAAGEQAE